MNEVTRVESKPLVAPPVERKPVEEKVERVEKPKRTEVDVLV